MTLLTIWAQSTKYYQDYSMSAEDILHSNLMIGFLLLLLIHVVYWYSRFRAMRRRDLGLDTPTQAAQQSTPLAVQLIPTPKVIDPKHGDIYFEPGEPRTFAEYEGQEHVVEKLQLQLGGMKPDTRVIRPQGFKGVGGMGKTLLARITANEWRNRLRAQGITPGLWIEVWPESLESLDAIMQLVAQYPYSGLFFDEIHMLSRQEQTALYEFLNTVGTGAPRYQFRNSTQATLMGPTLVVAATTDAGELEMPFLRRFEWHDLKPATPKQLREIFARRAELPIDPQALDAVVEKTHFSGSPWEGLAVLRLMEQSARDLGRSRILLDDAERIFRIEQMDNYGLRWLDRQVLRALFGQPKERMIRGKKELVCYAASEMNTCLLAGIDQSTYRESVRPRLMSRGLLGLRPYYGQALTDRAVTLYGPLLSEVQHASGSDPARGFSSAWS